MTITTKTFQGKELQQLKDVATLAIEDTLGKEKASRFMEATNHPYSCKCELCKEWHEIMGTEG